MWHGIQGHDAVVERFRQSLAAGRLASSYLFLGPTGIGKFSFALKLAQALLCLDDSANELEPCGDCESCRLAEAGNHPDLDLVGLPEGKRWLPVELLVGDRDHRHQVGLCHNIALRPMLGKRRVAIIDDADHLTTESANCLLKTLEEPPSGAVLILIGTSRGRQLPTILSRAQIIRFEALPTDILRNLLLEKGITADPQYATDLAGRSEGTLQRAIDLADPELDYLQQQLLPQLVPGVFESMRAASELAALVNQAGKEADARRRRLRAIFRMVGDYFRHEMRVSCGAVSNHEAAQTKTDERWLQLGSAAQDCALAALDRCLEAEVELDRNANQATLLECWLDDLAGILSGPLVASLEQR